MNLFISLVDNPIDIPVEYILWVCIPAIILFFIFNFIKQATKEKINNEEKKIAYLEEKFEHLAVKAQGEADLDLEINHRIEATPPYRINKPWEVYLVFDKYESGGLCAKYTKIHTVLDSELDEVINQKNPTSKGSS